ncbi:MAG: DUF445 family protein [Clostridiales bacterium]|nr:DUF445 family protein [Candidatus Crickella caballi]
MDWSVFLKYIVPPLVGAVIGYFTNLIAVKMLFFPHEEKHIFGRKVPFTPGAIPKGKARLAKSAGDIVAGQLITQEDISNKMLTEEIEKPLIEKAMNILAEDIGVTGAVLTGGREKYDRLEESFTELLTEKIIDAIKRMDIPELLKTEGKRMTNEALSKSKFLSIVVTDHLVDKMMLAVGDEMDKFVDGKGHEMVGDIVTGRIHDLSERTPLHVLEQAGYDEDFVRAKLTAAYRESVVNAVNSALRRIDVSGVIEDKINSMSVDDLEKGVLTVMKTELDMIVSLGALIGFVLGCINIFV